MSNLPNNSQPGTPRSLEMIEDAVAAYLHGELSTEEIAQLRTTLEALPDLNRDYFTTLAMHELLEKDAKAAQPSADFEQRMVQSIQSKLNQQAPVAPETPWESVVALWVWLRTSFLGRHPYGSVATLFVLGFIACTIVGSKVVYRSFNSTFSSSNDPLALADPTPGNPTSNSTSFKERDIEGRLEVADGATRVAGGLVHDAEISSKQKELLRSDLPSDRFDSGTVAASPPLTQPPATPSTTAPTGMAMAAPVAINTTTPPPANTPDAPAQIKALVSIGQTQSQADTSISPFSTNKRRIRDKNIDSITLPVSPGSLYSDKFTGEKAKDLAPQKSAGFGSVAGFKLEATKDDLDPSRKLIRNADIDLEVNNFGTTLEKISSLAHAAGGYVDSKSSQRGGNGKLQGVVVLKVLPQYLDSLLARVPSLGEVKNLNLRTEDVTKDYYDTSARLKNAQRMEDQLAELLKHENGKVSDLLQVERELGRVRGEIETMQGQLKLYDFQVQYATITLNLMETDLTQAAAYLLKENDSLTLLSPEVEVTFQNSRKLIEGMHGQILQADINRASANNINGEIEALIPPEQIDAFHSQIKTLGRVDNLIRNTQRVAQDGGETNAPAEQIRTDKDKVHVQLSLQWDNQAPIQQTNLILITSAIETKAHNLKDKALKAGASIRSSSFEHLNNGEEVAHLTFKLPLNNYAALVEDLKSQGRVETFTVTRQDRPDQLIDEATAQVQINLTLHSQADLIAEDHGIFAMFRSTFSQGFGALFLSIRMIGIIIAFVLPWLITLAILAWVGRRIYIWRKRK